MPDQKPGGNEPSEEELEKRLQALLGDSESPPATALEAPLDNPLEEDEVASRFKEVSDRLDKAQARRRMPDVPEWDYKRRRAAVGDDKDSANYRGLGIGISIGYTLVGCMVLGWFIGWLIDRKTGGNAYQAFLALAGCIVGLGMAFWLMNREGSK